MNEALNRLAQANALLQGVHVRGREDLGAMLAAMQAVEEVMRGMMGEETGEAE